MLESFDKGIIRIRALDRSEALNCYNSILGAEWRQARVALKYDGFRIKEIVAKDQRDALSVHPDFVVDKTTSLIDAIYPVADSAVKSCWGLNVGGWSSPQFTLYDKGHFIKAHRDSGDAFPNRLFTIVTYLTDEYEGGKIRFPGIKSEFHPNAGESLIFPSDFVHDVEPVSSGHKCVFLFFLDSR